MGRTVDVTPDGAWALQSWPRAATAIPFGINRVAPLELGIARHQRTHMTIGDRAHSFLEFAGAERFGFERCRMETRSSDARNAC